MILHMATKQQCKKCSKRKKCPILRAIKEYDAAGSNELLRNLCVEYLNNGNTRSPG